MREIGFMQGRLSPPVNGRIQAFPWEHWRDEFRLGADAGFPFLEWTLDAEGLSENPLMTTAGQREIRTLIADTGVHVPSVTGDCFMQEPFWKADRELMRLRLHTMQEVLEACSELEVRIVVVPLVDNGSLVLDTHRQAFLDGFAMLSHRCAELGVRIAIESDFAADALANLAAALPVAVGGINYDIGNSASLGYVPAAEIEAYGPRILNVHVKDRIRGGSTVPLGTGDADFTSTFSALSAAGYRGDFVLQTARASDGDHLGALTAYRDMVRQWLNSQTWEAAWISG